MSWMFFHKLGSPKWFYEISGKLMPWIAAFSLLALVVGSVWGLVFAPQDYQQGNSFRIIYIHWFFFFFLSRCIFRCVCVFSQFF